MALESNRGARRPHSAAPEEDRGSRTPARGQEDLQGDALGGAVSGEDAEVFSGAFTGGGDSSDSLDSLDSSDSLDSRFSRMSDWLDGNGSRLPEDIPRGKPEGAAVRRLPPREAGAARGTTTPRRSASPYVTASSGQRASQRSSSSASSGARRMGDGRNGNVGGSAPVARRTSPSASSVSSTSGRAGSRRTAARTGPYDPYRAGERAAHYNVRHVNEASASDEELELERRIRKNKQKGRRNRFLLMAVVEMITLVFIVCASHVVRYMSLTQNIEFDVAKVKNPNIDIQKQKQMEGYWTVVVFGVDSRDGTVGRGANADVQIIANIDMGNGDIRLVSVYRDSYMNLGNGTRYAKINEAYAAGGPEQAVSALNKNLDLDIENYVTFNWKAVADAISMIGGVDLDITEREFYYMNAFIHETCIKSGISEDNPAAEYIAGPGLQHLDGVQTVAYARLRYMDDDFQRTRRQREVISQVLEKSKKTNLATLTQIIDTVFPQVATNVDMGDVIQLARGVARYNIKEAEGFPQELKTQMMGKKGDCVVPVTLASNVTWLHGFLFGDEDYDPSSAVWTYSNKIKEDSNYYKSGGDAEAGAGSGRKASEETTARRYTEEETEAPRTTAAETEDRTEYTRRAEEDEDEDRERSTTSSRRYDDEEDEDEDREDGGSSSAAGSTRETTVSSQRPGADEEDERRESSSGTRATEDDDEEEVSTTRSGASPGGGYERDSEGNYRDGDGYIVPTDGAGDPAYGGQARESTEAPTTTARQTEAETTHASTSAASPAEEYDDREDDSAGPGGGTTEAEQRPGSASGSGGGQSPGNASPGGDSSSPGGGSDSGGPGGDSGSPGGGEAAAEGPPAGGDSVIVAEGPGAA